MDLRQGLLDVRLGQPPEGASVVGVDVAVHYGGHVDWQQVLVRKKNNLRILSSVNCRVLNLVPSQRAFAISYLNDE